VLAAGAVLDRVRAEVVVGFGGYVAAPVYLAARRQGLPIVVHEANARPGVANRLAARMTAYVFTAAPGVRLAHATAIGIPLRPAITGLDRPALRGAARQRFGLRPGGPVLLVTGGSQGARAINAAVSGAAAALRAAGGALLVDDGGLDPAWIETTLIPVLTDPGRIAAMSARASAAGAPDADVVLARHVLTAVAERRRLAS
jgi:UDP-N-acetylglucosamine--N-acetylmuramyl-(pentapeptide) pyrophosphoryl-undecaprenol N-acetylglucosamine transferase